MTRLWSRLPWPEIVVTTLVIAVGAGVYLYAHRNEASLDESRRRGADVVEALSAYHTDHGTYPERLSMLIPRYASTVEPPTWGMRRWSYRTYVADTGTVADSASDAGTPEAPVYFQLSVAANESGYPVLYYDFQTRRWVLNN
jgi:hypothetical protein